MQIKENKLFYTPKSQDELLERIDAIANASDNPGAIWTVAMMSLNWAAVNQQTREKIAKSYGL